MNEIAKLEGITNEKDRCIVAHHVPVAFVGIELEGEASWIAFSVRRTFFAPDGRKAQKCRRTLAKTGEKPGARVPGHVRIGADKISISSRALGMHDPLGNPLTIEMGHLLKK